MSSTDEAIPSKMLAVLCQINDRLEEQDRRLQDIYSALRAAPLARDQDSTRTEIVTYSSFALTQKVHPDGKRHLEEIEIFGQELLALLERIANVDGYCPEREPRTKPRRYVYPFTNLMIYWDALSIIASDLGPERSDLSTFLSPTTVSTDTRAALGNILQCLEEAANCQDYLEERCENAKKGLLRFDHLPTLFAPGSILVHETNTHDQQAAEVLSCEVDLTSRPNVCVIKYWHYDWHIDPLAEGGSVLTKVGGQFKVERFDGTSRISELTCQPFASFVNKETAWPIVQLAVERCRIHLNFLADGLAGSKGPYIHCSFTGAALFSGDITSTRYSGEVIIDPETYKESNMNNPQLHYSSLGCTCKGCAWIPCVNYESLPHRRRFLMPTSVAAFAIAARKWARLSIAYLRKYRHGREVFEGLQVPDPIQKNVMSQIEKYMRENGKQDPEFWTRVIFQFHGPRGVGKGFCLDMLARLYERPVLRLSFADLGLDLASFEKNLDQSMSLASHWGAILAIGEADELLEMRHLHSDLTRNALVEALANRLPFFHGICVFLTSRISNLDHVLKAYIKPIIFSSASVSDLSQILGSHLRHEDVPPEHIDRILEWFEATATPDWAATGRDIRDLVTSAVNLASAHSRVLNLGDILEAYTAKTGRPEEWDVVTDVALYTSVDSSRHQTLAPKLKQKFPSVWSIPDDGRLTLVFTMPFLESRGPGRQVETRLDQVHEFTMALRQNNGMLAVVDWGWPKGLWSSLKGCVYDFHETSVIPVEKWDLAGFSYGLRRLVGDNGMRMSYAGKPWRRLLLCEGFASVPRNAVKFGWPEFGDHNWATSIPWCIVSRGEDAAPPEARAGSRAFTRQRVETLISPIISMHYDCTLRRHSAPGHNGYVNTGQGFHIVFYELLNPRQLPEGADMRHITTFYNMSLYMRKSCFTMLPVASQLDGKDPLHWTIICLTPTQFWSRSTGIADSASPSLRAQTCGYVAKALADVSVRWRAILQKFDEIFDNSKVLREPDKLQDIIFDDDAFSTSKKYFWAINFIQDALNLVDDNIRQWNQYQKVDVDPFLKGHTDERTEDYVKKSRAALEKANIDAIEACAELTNLRQALQDRLEQVKMMRDGIFNASAVMESRAATKLAENVKLLTFVSIFFLPLAFCTSIWSVNESYSRKWLGIVAAVVAVSTYLITFNLNNLVQLIRFVYLPQRGRMVKRMEDDSPKWSDLADRFRAFQRSEKGIQEPSEWMILVFSIRQMFKAAVNIILCRRTREQTPGP